MLIIKDAHTNIRNSTGTANLKFQTRKLIKGCFINVPQWNALISCYEEPRERRITFSSDLNCEILSFRVTDRQQAIDINTIPNTLTGKFCILNFKNRLCIGQRIQRQNLLVTETTFRAGRNRNPIARSRLSNDVLN